MSIIEILNGTNNDISVNIDLLAKDYLKKIGRKVCRTCPSDVQYMILSLKNFYNMTQFKFIRHAAIYKNAKGDKTTISNGNMTDEKAILFLKTDSKRIKYFAEYPSDWKELIKGKKRETAKAKEIRLAAEAEILAAKIAKEKLAKEKLAENGSGETGTDKTDVKADVKAENNVPDTNATTRKDLEKMSLKELRAKYPEVKATSIKDFIDKVLA